MRKFLFIVTVASMLLLALAGCEELPENKATPGKPAGTGSTSSYPAGGQGQGVYPAGGKPTSAAATAQAYPGPVTAPLFQIVKADNSTFVVTRAGYDRLTKVKVSIEGKDVTGVKVTDLLKDAKVTTYKKITITGSNGKLELEAGKVDDKLIVTVGDTVGIQSPALSSDKWIKGITQIKIDN